MAQSSMCKGFLENVTKVIIPFSSLALDSHPYETIRVCPHWKVQHKNFYLTSLIWFDDNSNLFKEELPRKSSASGVSEEILLFDNRSSWRFSSWSWVPNFVDDMPLWERSNLIKFWGEKNMYVSYSLGIKNGSSKCTWILEITGQQKSTSQLFSRKLTVGVVRNPDCYWKHHCYKDEFLNSKNLLLFQNIRTCFICHGVKNIHNKHFTYL